MGAVGADPVGRPSRLGFTRVIGMTPTGGMRLSGRLVKFDFLNPPLPPSACHALILSGAVAIGPGTQAEVPDSRGVPSLWRKRTTLDFSSAAGSWDLKSRGHERSIIGCTDQPT